MAIFVIACADGGSIGVEDSRWTELQNALSRRIALLPQAEHFQIGRVWIVDAETTSDEIRDHLTAGLSPSNKLVIASVGQDAAWTGLAKDESEWLLARL